MKWEVKGVSRDTGHARVETVDAGSIGDAERQAAKRGLIVEVGSAMPLAEQVATAVKPPGFQLLNVVATVIGITGVLTMIGGGLVAADATTQFERFIGFSFMLAGLWTLLASCCADALRHVARNIARH